MSNALVTDRKLPGLATAMDRSAMRRRLSVLLDAQGELSVELLKHVPGKRAVLSYAFADGPRLVGKMYRKDRAQRHHDLLSTLHGALQGATRTPRPLACWQDLGLVIQEHMPGRAAPHWSEMEGQPASMDRIAEALADLHEVRIDGCRQADLTSHLHRTCHPGLQSLRQALPHLGAQLRDLEGEMLARQDSIVSEPVLCHGDFGPGQILLTPQQVSIVDLDGMSYGDAALDVGNFMVGLYVHAGLAGRDLGRRFLQCYRHRRGIETLPGLPHYQAFAFVRRAMILFRKRSLGWEEQCWKMIDQACRSL